MEYSGCVATEHETLIHLFHVSHGTSESFNDLFPSFPPALVDFGSSMLSDKQYRCTVSSPARLRRSSANSAKRLNVQVGSESNSWRRLTVASEATNSSSQQSVSQSDSIGAYLSFRSEGIRSPEVTAVTP